MRSHYLSVFRVLVTVVTSLCLVPSARCEDEPAKAETGASGAEAAAHPLDGKRFRSLEKLVCGERRDGTVAMDYWEITFKGKTYFWRHLDVITQGSWDLDSKTGLLAFDKDDRSGLAASFDAKTGVLTWGKHKYKAVKSQK